MEKDEEKNYQKIVVEMEKKLSKKKEKKLSIHQPNKRSNLIGLILLISGFILIINPTSLNYTSFLNKILTNPDALNIKIGFGLILIGLFLIVLINEKTSENLTNIEQNNYTIKIKLLISEKITFALSLWIILLIFITYAASLEIFFILIFIGTLVLKELTDYYISPNLKNRINIFLFAFLIIFIIIITQKIINVF